MSKGIFTRWFAKKFGVKTDLVAKARRHGVMNVELLETRLTPANFTPGNIALLDLASGTGTLANNTTGSILEVQPSGTGQSPVQTVSIASTGTNAIRFSDSGTSSYLSRTNDGTLLALAGYNTTNSTATDLATLTSANVRAVASLNSSATFALNTTYTESVSGDQTRDATSANDTNWVITDKGGLFTNGATTSSIGTVNVGETRSFGGVTYVAGTGPAAAVSTIASPTATSLTGLPGISSDANIKDFYLVQSGSNGLTYDVLYTLDTSSINKFSLVNGTWVANGSATVTGTPLSVIAASNGSGAYLYYDTSTSLIRLTDATGWVNSSSASSGFALTGSSTLYTAATNNLLKGMDFVPVTAVSTTTTVTSVSPLTTTTGSPVTFTANVSAASAPTSGLVSFYSGTTLLATATSATTSGTTDTFTVTTTAVPAGSYSAITASYSGGTGFLLSSSTAYSSTLTVSNPSVATTTVITSITPLSDTSGTPVTFTATVTAGSGSTAPSAGSVKFYNGGTSGTLLATISSETTSGTIATFTLTTSSVPAGSFASIVAYYTPGIGYGSSNSTVYGSTLNVGVTTTAITSITPLTVNSGTAVTFTATVTAAVGSTAPTAGSVAFYDTATNTVVATATSETTNGTIATFTVSSTTVPVGVYSSIQADYTGGTGFANSNSTSYGSTLTVNSPPAGPYTPGDLAVLQFAATGTNTTGSVIELAPTGTQANPVLIQPISSTGTNALRFSDSGTSGFLTDTNDQTLLTLAAYNSTNSTVADLATLTTPVRAVATLDSNNDFTLQTTYTETVSGDQTRSATSVNDSTFYITDKGGIFTNNATATSLVSADNNSSLNTLVTRAFGGTVYVASTKFSGAVSTLASTTATTAVGLPGLVSDSTIQDFYLVQSGSNGPTYDTLYTLDQGTVSATINKFALISGTWTSEGSYTLMVNGTATNATSMVAANNGSGGVSLFVVTTAQAVDNQVVALTDTATYNQPISVTTAPTVLYTATGTSTLKGIAFAPLAATTITESVSATSVQPSSAPVTFTANLSSPNAPTGINTGTVYFIDVVNGVSTVLNPAGATVTNGVATFTGSSQLSLGQHYVYAYYTGASTIAAGTTTIANATSSTINIAVTGNTPSAITITSNTPNPTTLGATVTLVATVTTGATGTVQFFDNGTLLGTAAPVTSGGVTTATFQVNTLLQGVHSNITVQYNGDATFKGSVSPAATETVNAPATITVTAPNGGETTPDSTVTFTASVVGNGLANLPNGMPSGSVEFFEDSSATPFATATLTGSGNTLTTTVNLSGITPGSHLITATYEPSASSSYASVATVSPPWIETAQEALTPGDLIVLRRPANPSNAAQLVDLDEYTPAGTLVETITLPDSITAATGGATATFTGSISSNTLTITAIQSGTLTPGELLSGTGLSSETIIDNQISGTKGGVGTYTVNLAQTLASTTITATTTATNIIAESGHAATEGALALSGDGNYLSVFGFDLPIGVAGATSTDPSTTPRTVASIGLNGTVDTSTVLTVASGDTDLSNPRGAVTENGQQFWVVGSADASGAASGIEYATDGTIGTPTAIGPATASGDGVEILGGQLYVSGGSDVIDEVGTGLPTSSTTLTALPGLVAAYATGNPYNPEGAATVTPNPYGFLLFNHLTGTSVNPDTLYIADQTYGLLKFYNSTEVNGDPTTGTWVIVGQKLNNNNGIEGLSGYEVNPGTSGYYFVINATAAESTGNPGNQLITFTDTNAYNAGFPQGSLFNVLFSEPYGSTAVFSGLVQAPGYVTNTTISDTGSAGNYTFSAKVSSVGSSTLPSQAITAIAEPDGYPGTTVNVTTLEPLGVSVGQLVEISGVSGGFDGSYYVTSVSGNTFSYVSAVSGLETGIVNPGSATAAIVQGSEVPTGYVAFSVDGGAAVDVAIPTVAITGATETNSTVTITLSAPLTGLTVGQTVAVSGIVSSYYGSAVLGYDGNVTVLSVGTNDESFTYAAPSGLQSPAFTGSSLNYANGAVVANGVVSYIPSPLTTSTSHTVTAAYLGDLEDGTSTGVLTQSASAITSGDLIVNEVSTAIPASGITSIAVSASSTTSYNVTATSISALSAGATVTIAGTTGFNGTYTITGVNTANNTFSITAASGIATWTGTGTATEANAAATSILEYTTGAGQSSPVQTINLPSSGASPLTEGATATLEGYLTDSSDGNTAVFAGYSADAGNSTTGANGVIAVVSANGSIESSTLIPNADTTIGTSNSVKAVASADGLGFYVATNDYIQYVPFGNSAETSTTTISDFFTSGKYQSSQSANDVVIGGNGGVTPSGNDSGSQLFGDAGSAAQSDGVPAADGPFTVGTGLPTDGGQSASVIDPSDFVTSSAGTPSQYATSEQFSVSPDGNIIVLADARTNGAGGVYIFEDYNLTGTWQDVASYKYTTTGLTGLSVDWSNYANGSATIYGVTTNAATGYAGNSIVSFAVTNLGNENSGNAATIATPTVLATAAANESFRGVALAPTAPGSAPTTTALYTPTSGVAYPTGALTASVSAAAGYSGTATPTGYVSFQNNGIEIGSAPLLNGTATLVSSTDFAPGSYTSLVAVYTGDTNFTASTSAAVSSTVTISQATPGIAFTTPPTITSVATGVTDPLTVTIAVPTGTSPIADSTTDGTVTFWIGSVGTGIDLGTVAVTANIASGALSFEADLPYVFSTYGTYSVTAVYSGNEDFVSATASPISIYVVPPSTTGVSTSSTNPTVGTSVTLTATVNGNGVTAPSGGTVTFYQDQVALTANVTYTTVGTTLQASVTLPTALTQASNTLLPGLQTITAIYSGSNTYFGSTGVYEQAVQAAQFVAGDTFTEQIGDGSTPLIAPAPNPNLGKASIGSTIYVDEYTPSGTLVEQVILPSGDGTVTSQGDQTAIHAIVADAQQSLTQLTISGNEQYLYLVGYDSNNPNLPANVAAAPELHYTYTTPRAVARVSLAGVVQTIGLMAGTSGGVETAYNITGVYSPDGNQFYLTGGYTTSNGHSGVDYFSSFTTSAALQTYTAEIANTSGSGPHDVGGLENLNGNLVVLGLGSGSSYGGTEQIVSAFSGLPTAAATPTTLPGLPGTDAAIDPNDVYFTHLSGTNAPAGINTMYVTDGTGFGDSGTITKWTYNGTTWSLTDTISATTSTLGFFWLAGTNNGTNVTIYTTYVGGGDSDTGGGDIYTITDSSSGYGQTFASSTVSTLLSLSTTSLESYLGVAVLESPTTTTLTSVANNPSTIGTNLPQYSVTVTPTFGSIPTAPQVVYVEDASNFNAIVATQTLTNGSTGTFSITGLAAGTHNLFAVYTSSSVDLGSQSSQVTQSVNNALLNTTTTLVDNGSATPTYGQSVSFTVTVADTTAGGALPTGTVQLEDASNGNALVGSSQTLVPGTANSAVTFSLPLSLSLGAHNLIAVYSGDTGSTGHNPSTSSTVAVTIVGIATSTSLAAPVVSAPDIGTNDLTFTATVAPTTGTTEPTGTVVFYDNLLPISATVSYSAGGNNALVATITVSTALIQAPGDLTPGVHSITAIFTPSGYFATSSATAINQAVNAQAFGANDQLVYRLGSSAPGAAAWNTTTGSAVNVDEYNSTGVLQQTIALPTANGNGYEALINIGAQQITGQLSTSGNGAYVVLAGYDATPGVSNPANVANLPLTVARIGANGTVATEAISGAQASSGSFYNYLSGIYSPDGNQFYLSGQEDFGVDYIPSFTAGTTVAATQIVSLGTGYANEYGLESVNNQLYVITESASPTSIRYGVDLISTSTAGQLPTTTGQTLTPVPGYSTNYSADVYFAHLTGTNAPAGINTMYVTTDGSSASSDYDNGKITKYSLVGSTWVSNGSITAVPTPATGAPPTGGTVGFFWLSGSVSNNIVSLYETFGPGTTTATTGITGALEFVTDTSGYNAAQSSTAVTVLNTSTSTASVGEVYHGVAAVPVSLTTPTTTTLTDSGPNPSLLNTAVTFTVTINGGSAINGETVTILDGTTSVATPTLTNGTATFTLSSLGVGTHSLSAVYATDGTYAGSTSAVVTQTVQSTFGVNSVTATANGVVLFFNAPINAATTVLYTTPGDTTLGSADVTVVGATSGAVRGSLVIDPTNPYEATFVATSGPLTSDTYTVTVTSAVQAVGGGTMSGIYSSALPVTAPTTNVVSVPGFARGPGQSVVLPSSTAIPVSITNATNVTQASFTLTYDPTLLTINSMGAVTPSSAATSAGLTASYSITNVDARHSVLTVSLSGGTGLTATTATQLVTITASVPDSAPYLDKSVLNLSNVTVNATVGAGVSGVDVVAYLGDVLGTGLANATDASLVDQVGAGAGTGFSQFKDLDPSIIGGVDGGLNVNATDASLINEAASGQSIGQIPPVPTLPAGTTLVFGGPDPYLYLSAVRGAPGQTVTETLYLDVTDPNGIQLTALDEAIGFDAGEVQVSNIRGAAGLASLGSYGTASTVDNNTGVLLVGQAFEGIGLPAVVPYGTDVAVLQFDVRVDADAPAGEVSGLTLLRDGSINGQLKYTAISDNEGALTWTTGKAPSNSGNTAVDGSLTVVAALPAVSEPVGSTSQTSSVVAPRIVQPVRRVVSSVLVTPIANSASQDAGGVQGEMNGTAIVAGPSAITLIITDNVGPAQSFTTGGVAVPSVVNIALTIAPLETAQVASASNASRSADAGASLSLVAQAASKVALTASVNGTGVKSTTSSLDEVYRLLGAPLSNGLTLGLTGDDSMDPFADANYLELDLDPDFHAKADESRKE